MFVCFKLNIKWFFLEKNFLSFVLLAKTFWNGEHIIYKQKIHKLKSKLKLNQNLDWTPLPKYTNEKQD